ncbi:hypothetical protein EI94DRAFT_850317 [Lactarius quietus]|nr:hypothetical protein EI94DRAFT_850317 [Lactarius quietus]
MPIEPLPLGPLRTPHPHDDLGENAELPPSTSNHYNVPQLNVHQPDYRDNLHRGNLWYQGPQPPATSLGDQYTYQTNPSIGYPPPGNAEHMFVAPGPSSGEYHIPPARDPPNNGVRDRPLPMPDVTNTFSRNVPNSDHSRVSATEDLKRLTSRYLDNPHSRVDTFRVGLSPSGSRLRVMIVLDIDI